MTDPVLAARQLAQADHVRRTVGAKAAKGYTPFIGWGLFSLAMIPPFDVLSGKVWGPYFLRGKRRVRKAAAEQPAPGWYGLVWTLWYCSLIFGASFLHPRAAVAYTVPGVASAVPLLVRGIRLRGRATT